MKKIILSGVFILFVINIAQSSIKTKRKAENKINLSFTPQLYLNKGWTIHDGDNYNQQVIYPQMSLVMFLVWSINIPQLMDSL